MQSTDVQLIRVSQGEIENTWITRVTEVNDKDISSDMVEVGLGTSSAAPTVWRTPDVLTWVADNEFTVELTIGGNYIPALNSYWLWVKVHDVPEVKLLRGHQVTVN